jgi:uncharacterized membrane protein YgaE (UPF0421/DUF939 family)
VFELPNIWYHNAVLQQCVLVTEVISLLKSVFRYANLSNNLNDIKKRLLEQIEEQKWG